MAETGLTETRESELSAVINGTGTDEERQKAVDELATANLKLVYDVVQREFPGTPPWDFADVVGDGYVGLMRAARSYDSLRGRFSTWGSRLIYQSISAGFRNRNPKIVYIPNRMDVSAVCEALESAPQADDDQICEMTGLPPERVAKAKEILSIVTTAIEDAGTLEDPAAEIPSDVVARRDLVDLVARAARELGFGERELELIRSSREDGVCERMARERGVVSSSIRMLKSKLLLMIRRKIVSVTGEREFRSLSC